MIAVKQQQCSPTGNMTAYLAESNNSLQPGLWLSHLQADYLETRRSPGHSACIDYDTTYNRDYTPSECKKTKKLLISYFQDRNLQNKSTYCPVVQWSKVKWMITIRTSIGLIGRSCCSWLTSPAGGCSVVSAGCCCCCWACDHASFDFYQRQCKHSLPIISYAQLPGLDSPATCLTTCVNVSL